MNRIKKTFLLLVVLMSFLLVACNQSVEFTIYFDSKGGSEVSSISTGGNSAVVIPANPIKEGFEFDGWYWDNNTFNRPFTANSLLEEPISSNMTVYAKWISEAEYSITYVLNSGALSSGVNNTYKIEELPLTLPVPIRDGYEFDGWYTNENLEGSQVTSISLGEEDNKTYYAKWTLIEEEVLGIVTATGFEIDGTNMYIEVPNTTTTYSFIGQITVSSQATWDLYNDILGENRIATKTISLSIGDNTVYILVTKDDEIKLYTVTVRRLPIYEVSFNTDGGSLLESQFIQEDDMLQEPTTIKSGYTLIGWEDDNNEVTFPIEIEEDMLIKAKWEVNQNTLSFDSNGGVGEMGSVLVETNETTALPKNTFTRIGYTFVGWSTSEIGEVEYLDESSYTMGPQATYTLYAKWAINSYTLELTRSNALAGSVTGSGIKEYNSEVTITATTNPGYTFIGWYNGEDLVSSLATYTFNMLASDLSYEAKWEANQYTITFVTNGGTEIAQITQDYNSIIEVTTIKEGYKLASWCIDEGLNTVIDISYMPNFNATVYAKWVINSYTLELTRSNALAGSVTGSGIKEYNSEVTITATTNPGYTFIGWYNDEDLVSSLATYTFNMLASDLSYEAKWEANQNTLSFDSNGGAGEMSSVLVETNETINLPKNIFTKTGYAFIGWSTSIEGGVVYLDEANYTMGTLASYTLYAKWEKPSTEGLMFELKEDNTYEVIGYQGISTEIIIEHTYREKTITSIGEDAFRDCSSLTSITIPSSVTSIAYLAFYGCSSLTSISLPFVGASRTATGTSALFGYIFGPYSYTGGSSTKQYYASSSSITYYIPTSLKTVIITDATKIGYGAFSGCSGLTSITIPSSVTSIGDEAFSGCSSLTSISLPFVGASRTATGTSALFGYIFGTISYTGGSSTKQYYASSSSITYYIPTSLKTVIITDATKIGYGAFSGCSSLTSITIPSSVTSIGDEAFYCCSSLTSIIIPEGVTSIGDGAFIDCSSLTSVVIPSSVTSIGGYAFYGCSSLTSVVIPNSVTSIGDYAFYGCSSLTSITIPSSVTIIGDYAFRGCSSLTSIVIPSSVTSIGDWAFRGCSGLTSVVIPNSVTSIGDYAFYGCSSLTSITIPSSVTSIGDNAFYGCSGLTSITIPEGVTSIGYAAFSSCWRLTSITIPSSVTSIGGYAFSGCSSLTSIKIPSSVTSIGNNAFYYCSSLTSIKIPSSVTSIGNNAFYGCSSLTIYAEASSKPAGWDSYWNPANRPVVWGYTGE